jgi:23S rRNA G2445 N2-methylase RlmL
MVRCANISAGALVVDPFCGSGTLLLEALDVYRNSIKCMGMDVSKRSTDGARENALAEGYGSDICDFIPSDARGLRRILKDNSVDTIITNLPWGVITGHKNKSELQTMYEVFLRTAWYVLKDKARVVMLVLRGLQLTRLIRKLGGRYRLLRVKVIRTANNLPCIVVIEKLPIDEIRESVKGQLSYLSQYVSFSPEVYEAIHFEPIDNEIP